MSDPVYSEERIVPVYHGFTVRLGAAAQSIYTVTPGRRAQLRSVYGLGTSGEAVITLFDSNSGVAYGSGTGTPVFEFPLKSPISPNSGQTGNLADFTIGDNSLRGVEFYSSIVGFIRVGGLNALTAAQYSGGPLVAIGVLEY